MILLCTSCMDRDDRAEAAGETVAWVSLNWRS